jgi:hypothetical protein
MRWGFPVSAISTAASPFPAWRTSYPSPPVQRGIGIQFVAARLWRLAYAAKNMQEAYKAPRSGDAWSRGPAVRLAAALERKTSKRVLFVRNAFPLRHYDTHRTITRYHSKMRARAAGNSTLRC